MSSHVKSYVRVSTRNTETQNNMPRCLHDKENVYYNLALEKHHFSMNTGSTLVWETLQEEMHAVDSENDNESLYD